MNRTGYVFSLIGGVLAIVFSVMLVVTGPILYAGEVMADLVEDNSKDLGLMWTTFGDYNRINPFLEDDLEDYIADYQRAFGKVDARGLKDISEDYENEAFEDMAHIYKDMEDYLPKLQLGLLACLIASVLGLVGAQVALKYQVAGGVMVLVSSAMTLIFSLVAGSIVPMVLASLLLVVGGVLQTVQRTPKIPYDHMAAGGQEVQS